MSDEEKDGAAHDPEKLPTRIKKWLGQHGYPLEMRVARAFQQGGCSRVMQSEFYETRDGEGRTIWREIDVAAQLGYTLNRQVNRLNKTDIEAPPKTTNVSMFFDFFFVAECKRNAAGRRPWLVFTNHTGELEEDEQRYVMSHPMTELGASFFDDLLHRDIFTELEFFKPRRLGYAAVQPILHQTDKHERENEWDGAYQAITSVLSAAAARANPPSSAYEIFRFVVPMVVINAPLFECYLNANGDVSIEHRVERGIYWRNPNGGLSDRIVYVVAESVLPAFIARARAAFEKLREHEDQMVDTLAIALDDRIDLD